MKWYNVADVIRVLIVEIIFKKKIGLWEMNVKISIYTWTGKCY